MNTRDLMDFSRKHLQIAGKMLTLLNTDKDHTLRMGKHITPELNQDTQYVFLVDEDFHVAMINGDNLEDWLICSCGNEGFLNQMGEGGKCCKDLAYLYRSEFLIESA